MSALIYIQALAGQNDASLYICSDRLLCDFISQPSNKLHFFVHFNNSLQVAWLSIVICQIQGRILAKVVVAKMTGCDPALQEKELTLHLTVYVI